MIRKTIIVMLTLGAVGTGAITFPILAALQQDDWSWCSASWRNTIVIVHRHGLGILHDRIIPGQVPDQVGGARMARKWEEMRESGQLTPSTVSFIDSFAPRGFFGARWGTYQVVQADDLLRVSRSTCYFRFWLISTILGAYPTLAFIRGPLRRYRRRKRGLCVTCGYDLRGSPGRCPECGAGECEK